jgi:hypothetical protein
MKRQVGSQDDIKPISYQEQRLHKLFDECQNTVIEQIIQPFGLSAAMFNDKDGGEVDTVHNVRNGVYAKEAEKEKFDSRDEYDSSKYHSHSNYKAKNAEVSQQKKNGTLTDAYTGKKVTFNSRVDLDHVNSAKRAHDDPGAYLADLDTADLVNDPSNLYATNSSINRSKGQKSMEEFISDWKERQPERQAKIAELSQKEHLTDQERKKLEKLTAIEDFSPAAARKIVKQAQKQYKKAVNKYYRSGKFVKSAAADAGKMAVKTAIQQALGKLLIEFTQASFYEIKMFIREQKNSIENIFEDIKIRLKRVMDKIIARLKEWKEIAKDIRDGLLAGFLSSLITTLVNVFATTVKRFVRAIREGIRSLIQAFKLLFFRPSDMTEEEALKLIIKLLTGIFITTIGISAETALNSFIQSVPVIGQLTTIITPVLMGILTGLSISLVSYIVDILFDLSHKSSREFDELLEIQNLQLAYAGQLNTLVNNYIQMGRDFEIMISQYDSVIDENDIVDVEYSTLNDNTKERVTSLIEQRQTRDELLEGTIDMLHDRRHIASEFAKTEKWSQNRKKKGK